MDIPDDGTKDRWANAGEIWHLTGAFLYMGWSLYSAIDASNMWWHFAQLAYYFQSIFDAEHGL